MIASLPPNAPLVWSLTRIQENRRRRGNRNPLMHEPHLTNRLGVWEPDMLGRGWYLLSFEQKGNVLSGLPWSGYDR